MIHKHYYTWHDRLWGCPGGTTNLSGLENSTCPHVFMNASGCRASENFDISSENQIFPIYANNFCSAGQVPDFQIFLGLTLNEFSTTLEFNIFS